MSISKSNLAPSMQTSLTRRYVLALSLIFCVLLATFMTFTRQTSIAANDAYLINISGMQRMLSQRIALKAKEIRTANSVEEADRHAEAMQQSLDKMYSNHKALTTGALANGSTYALSPELRDMYFGPVDLGGRVSKYILAARSFLQLYRSQGLAVTRAASRAEDNVAEARIDLLADLNAAVSVYEREAKHRIETFRTLELGFLILGVCILVVEALLIFRPMVKLTVGQTKALEERNQELAKISYRLAEKQGLAQAAAKTVQTQRAQPSALRP